MKKHFRTLEIANQFYLRYLWAIHLIIWMNLKMCGK